MVRGVFSSWETAAKKFLRCSSNALVFSMSSVSRLLAFVNSSMVSCKRPAIVFRLDASTPISSLLFMSHFQVVSTDVILLEIWLILAMGLTITLLQIKALKADSRIMMKRTAGRKRNIRITMRSAVCDREDTTNVYFVSLCAKVMNVVMLETVTFVLAGEVLMAPKLTVSLSLLSFAAELFSIQKLYISLTASS